MFKKHSRTNKNNLIICPRVIPLVFLAGFWVLAEAKNDGEYPVVIVNDGQSSNIKKDEGSTKGSAVLEQEIRVTMPIPRIQFASCEAYISLQSHQRNTLARVASTIEQKPCATSTGEYELLISVKDGNGVHQTLKFGETWEQKNDSPMEFSKDYPIGENVTLQRVMAQGMRCECSDS